MSDFRSEFYSKNKKTGEDLHMFPPPRKKVSAKDTGLRPKVRTIGGPGMKDSPAYKAQLGFYPMYQSAEAMEFAIDAYFIRIEEEKRPPTLAGLALALGFKSTKSLKAYEDKGDDYAHVVEVARTRVEEWKNELLLKGGTQTSGVIFDLKNNHGWAEKTQSTQTMETGDTLSQLLLALQGKVLRPALEGKSMPETAQSIEDAEYAEFTEELTQELTQAQLDEEDEDFI
jgi:hypothetical protein